MDTAIIEQSWQMWITFGIVLVGVVMYALEKVSIELISAGILAALLLFFQVFAPETSQNLDARSLLSGFADPALITIMALLAIGQGIFQTGALEGPTQKISVFLEAYPKRTLFLVFAVAFFISMFMNNTPVVVMFIPILASMALQLRGSASRYMMPLSFICILAGMTTLVGSSTNILVNGVLERLTDDHIGFFDPAWPGLILAFIGVIYIIFASKWLLPRRSLVLNERVHTGQQYIAEIRITERHPLRGVAPVAGLFPNLKTMTVRMIRRGSRKLLPPFEGPLEADDILTVSTTRRSLEKLLSSHPEYLEGMLSISGFRETSEQGASRMAITETVIAPGSRMINRTIEQAGFRRQTGCLVLGIQRRSHMIREGMLDIRLQAGDVLLLFGFVPQIQSMRDSRDLMLLDWATRDLPDIRRATVARSIFAVVIITAAMGWLPIVHAAFAGATLMIATGCLNIRQAFRAFDTKIFMLIGAAFAMGIALENTGGAAYIAHSVVTALEPFGPQILIGGMFLLVAIMTNLLSNSATAILFAPIAISVSNETGIDPKIMVLTVLFAANCSFATPIAYQTNLLVLGPGHYRFLDFCRFGIPLILLLWISYVLLLPYVYGPL
jgi:di/tricarboxylate transporter